MGRGVWHGWKRFLRGGKRSDGQATAIHRRMRGQDAPLTSSGQALAAAAGCRRYLDLISYTGNCWESGQLRGLPRVPIAVVGVCSSRAFLIHKWVEIFPLFQTAEPGRRGAAGVCTLKPHINMEIKQRMSKRFGWLLGVGVLVTIGALVACGSNYNQSSDGLV